MLIKILTSAVAVFIAIIAHEIAHGYVARFLGDNTAAKAGRLSLNPLRHIDFFGTIIVPILLFLSKAGFIFGWAKPVPVNYNALRRRKRDIVLVAAAGIITNLLLAALSSLLLQLTLWLPSTLFSGILAMFWLNMILFNIVLAVFNLLPIPPFDGGKILIELIQLIIRRPLSMRAQTILSYIGIAFILFVFIFVLRNDVIRFVLG